VRLQRLVLHAGGDDDVFALDLHPRLTVVSGAGRLEREGLVNELLGALGSSRPGVHLELTDDRGRDLAVFRPAGARHRVVDVGVGADVTAEFERGGAIDLLAAAGVAPGTARRTLCIAGSELTSDANQGETIRRLARLPQDRLWDAAEALREVEAELVRYSAKAGSSPEDAELVGVIEARHAEHQAAAERLESVRSTAFTAAAVLALLAVVAAWAVDPAFSVPFVVAAAGCTMLSWWRWRQVRAAAAAEQDVLRSAGLSSYLAFQLQRVDSLVPSQEERAGMVELAHIHREALECWRHIAGDVEVAWAIEHRLAIESASRHGPAGDADGTTSRAAVLAARLDAVMQRPVRPPVVLDEPFAGAADTELAELVAVVLAATSRLQLVLLTEDPRLAEWATLEHLAGSVAHLELGTPADSARPAPRHALT
jgi:hypothetical protein